MKKNDPHRNLRGQQISIAILPDDERKLVSELYARAKRTRAIATFRNWWMSRVADFYEPRGLTRPQIRQTAGYRIGQDLLSRKLVEQGLARAPDYRDDLESIISEQFKTQREFCKATGLSEDMLSHVLSKRKHLAVSTLEESLRRIGYALRITPTAQG